MRAVVHGGPPIPERPHSVTVGGRLALRRAVGRPKTRRPLVFDSDPPMTLVLDTAHGDWLDERLPRLAGHSTNLIAVFDPSDRLVSANPAFCAAYGVEPGERLSWSELMRRNHQRGTGVRIVTADFDRWLTSAMSRRGKQRCRGFESDLVDGRWVWMTETVDEHGWMLCVGFDVTALRQDERSLREDRDRATRASLTDALTGAGNRLFVLGRLDALVSKHRRTGRVASVAICDLDHFKRINDRHGHAAGDHVIRDFCRLAQAELRREDVFGRIGGEEFAVLLPGLELEPATAVAERLLGAVRGSRPFADQPDITYTVSIGVTMLVPTDCASSALSRADRALYEAKAAGRDCCRLAH